MAATGAERVFGTADGGLFALDGAAALPQIRKVAVFEPVLFVGQAGLPEFRATIARAEHLIASGDLAAAMSSLAADAANDPRTQSVSAPYRVLGRVLTTPVACRVLLALDALAARGHRVALRDLVPALIPELRVVAATEGTIDHYRGVLAQCLLMCGAGAPPLFTATRDALMGVLPHARALDLPGANHGAAQDQGGSPAAIAERLRHFFD